MNCSTLQCYIYIYLLSLVPSFESRYSLVVGIKIGLDEKLTIIVSTIGVITLSLMLVFLLNLLDDVLPRLKNSHIKIVSGIARTYLQVRARIHSRRELVERYGYFGLIVFVMVPLPGSGIWSGALLAHLLGLDRRKTFLSLIVGGLLSMLLIFMLILTGRLVLR